MTIKVARRFRYIGSPPACIALASAAVGEAYLEDGSRVITTWGRNLDMDDAQHYAETTTFKPVLFSDFHELIIPEEMATSLLITLVMNEGKWHTPTRTKERACGI